MVIIDVPIPARISSRFFISASGTGVDTSSNSLQYVQSRLHFRMGIMCTRIGWFSDTSALLIIQSSRARVLRNLQARFRNVSAEAFPICFTTLIWPDFPCPKLYLTLEQQSPD